MDSHFQILGSGSSGNCALLQTRDCRILIDAGFSGRRILDLLRQQGLGPDQIDAVFLTHEHQDHCQGFRGLSRYAHLTWFANRDTYEALDQPAKERSRWVFFETGSRFRFRDLEVDTFSIPHDAADPVGYCFSWGGEDLFNPFRSLAWVLDLGHVTALVRERIVRAQTLVVEANYDPALLERDEKRPWSVKQRIQGRHGHLSNLAVLELLRDTPFDRLSQVFLAHVSKDCNSLEAIRKTLRSLPPERGTCPIHWFNPQSGCSEPL
jgi:phosphoribosyl 1,2-cyclic phosphodiesterase